VEYLVQCWRFGVRMKEDVGMRIDQAWEDDKVCEVNVT
jgi:hypothetical protein